LRFESELKKGKFMIGECTKCHEKIWPPSDFCSICFGELCYREVKEPGILTECSSKDGKIFGIVKFEDLISVIGTIEGPIPNPGQMMRIASVGFDNSPKFAFTQFKS